MRTRGIPVLLCVAVVFATPLVHAAPCKDSAACELGCERTCADVALPSAVLLEGKTLCLNGMGVREATIFNVDVYVAGLYLERRGADGEAIARAEQLKVMRLRFVRNVERGEIAEAIASGFQRAAGTALPKLKPSIERLAAALPELKKGDTLTLTYRPGRGVELSHQGRVLTEIPGADFGAVLFRIWLGSHPPNEGLRRGLLGGRCG